MPYEILFASDFIPSDRVRYQVACFQHEPLIPPPELVRDPLYKPQIDVSTANYFQASRQLGADTREAT